MRRSPRLRLPRRRRRLLRLRPGLGRSPGPVNRSRTLCSPRGGRNVTARPPRSGRSSGIMQTPRLFSNHRRGPHRSLLPPPPSPPNQTARGSRTWRYVCCACSPSIDSEITSAMGWSLPCARPALRLWAPGSFRFPPRRSRLSCARCWCCCGGASGRCDTRRFSRCDTCSRRGTRSRRGSFPRLYRRQSPRWTTRTTTSGAPRRRLSFPRLGTFPRTRISPSCSARCGAC